MQPGKYIFKSQLEKEFVLFCVVIVEQIIAIGFVDRVEENQGDYIYNEIASVVTTTALTLQLTFGVTLTMFKICILNYSPKLCKSRSMM